MMVVHEHRPPDASITEVAEVGPDGYCDICRPALAIGKNVKIKHRFLVYADFSNRQPPFIYVEEPIWIKAPDGEVSSMTWEEFQSHSRVLLASRPLPDGKVTS